MSERRLSRAISHGHFTCPPLSHDLYCNCPIHVPGEDSWTSDTQQGECNHVSTPLWLLWLIWFPLDVFLRPHSVSFLLLPPPLTDSPHAYAWPTLSLQDVWFDVIPFLSFSPLVQHQIRHHRISSSTDPYLIISHVTSSVSQFAVLISYQDVFFHRIRLLKHYQFDS